MTQEQKDQQVGALAREIRETEANLQEYKELLQRYRERIQLAAAPWRELRVVYEDGTNPTLMHKVGDVVSLPTTDELTEAVREGSGVGWKDSGVERALGGAGVLKLMSKLEFQRGALPRISMVLHVCLD